MSVGDGHGVHASDSRSTDGEALTAESNGTTNVGSPVSDTDVSICVTCVWFDWPAFALPDGSSVGWDVRLVFAQRKEVATVDTRKTSKEYAVDTVLVDGAAYRRGDESMPDLTEVPGWYADVSSLCLFCLWEEVAVDVSVIYSGELDLPFEELPVAMAGDDGCT